MLNKAILMGRLTNDPELRHTQNNTAVTTFTLAVGRTYDRSGEQTDFIDIVAWSNTAEFVSKWFYKGLQVAVSGRIQTRNWEDKQGNKRKTVEVVAEEVHFAGSKKDSPARPEGSPGNAAPQTAVPDLSTDNSDFSELAEDDGELPF